MVVQVLNKLFFFSRLDADNLTQFDSLQIRFTSHTNIYTLATTASANSFTTNLGTNESKWNDILKQYFVSY